MKLRTPEEILGHHARREKGVYMDQASHQEGVVKRAIRDAQREAWIAGYLEGRRVQHNLNGGVMIAVRPEAHMPDGLKEPEP